MGYEKQVGTNQQFNKVKHKILKTKIKVKCFLLSNEKKIISTLYVIPVSNNSIFYDLPEPTSVHI